MYNSFLCEFFNSPWQGLISSDKIKLFLRMLRLNEFHTYGVNSNGIRVSSTVLFVWVQTLICAVVDTIFFLGAPEE